ncbi:MAG: YkgJ family cysteine cluster protein [Sphaerochaeta sp.]|jgi:Fe-S-cluster containining protein|nr:YkgJ family cysteine cluster protein [Sphaerochaeta sp.]
MDCFYADGLKFSCVEGCTYCCGVEPGYVFLSQDDLDRLCAKTSLSAERFIERYCHKVNMGSFKLVSLLEQPNYDCIFLKDRRCSVYDARPIQCRTYPFWPAIMDSEESWKEEGGSCPGIGVGREYSQEEIDELLSLQRGREPLMLD